MDWKQRMNNALEYLEANLDGHIDMNILAMKALTSPYNFQRMFSFLTDTTLANYIRGRRLSLAVHELINENQKVIDVALKFGYESPTSFARAFTQFHGITPREAKNSKANFKFYSKLTFDFNNMGIPYKGENYMKKTKKGRMILIDGMCGTEPSTVAQKLNRQFALHTLPHRWMHQEIAEHPIRDGEFTMGSTKTLEGMEINTREMLKRWQNLVDMIVESGEIYIIENCFFLSVCRYFAESAYTVEQTLEYFYHLSEILTKADTLLVYLRSPNVKESLEHAFTICGKWWKDLILTPSGEKYFHINEYKGDETIYQTWDLHQEISDEVFTHYSGDKLMLDTPVGSWYDHPEKILSHIDLPYIDVPPIKIQSPEQFCGKYSVVIDGEKEIVQIMYDATHKTLYAVAFWDYMKLCPIAPNAFEIESLPIVFTFSNVENEKAIIVTGEYDWGIVGKTLNKLN